MTTQTPASNSEARKRAAERAVPVQDIILKHFGVTDTADFKAAAAECASIGLDADDLRRIARAYQRGELAVPEEPEPEPWTLIPEGRESARVLRVNGVVLGPVWLESRSVLIDSVSAALEKKHLVAYAHQITSVERVQVVPEGARVLGEGEVAVPRELVERAREMRRKLPDDAVTVDDAIRLIRDLAAVEGGGDQ